MPWWDAPEGRLTHEVSVPCLCADPDFCTTALYIADVRIATKAVETLANALTKARRRYAGKRTLANNSGKPGA